MDEPNRTLQLTAVDGLEYLYRDVFQVFLGRDEVVIELGNRDRQRPALGTVATRIVLSHRNARLLHEVLGRVLAARPPEERPPAEGAE